MSRFVLTAQLQLQAPRNTAQVVNQIRRQLGNVSVNIDIQNGRQANQQISQMNQQLQSANKNAQSLGKNFAVSVRRFAAFSVASRGISLFTNKLSNAIEESIDFQRELIKIKQVSGATDQALSSLEKTITNLATSLGTSSKDLLSTSRILAQTGLQAAQLEVALSALAKTTVAPTFENIEKTAEGAVAILAQFGQGVGALEGQLGAINAVAGQFAVESGDLISVVRRTGGVFKSAGGDLNELIGLFTSVRATTRESSESIATGLRTIFTRIQRPQTIEFLKQFGVNLLDLEGKFVGPFEAVRQLSTALKGLEEGDIRFVQIAEELGGFRQIGKVIPLLQQFETAERARQAAISGATSLEKDVRTSQEALAIQIEKTRQNFLALIRDISETTSFQALVKTVLGLSDAFIRVADALKPVIPLMAAFAGFKVAKGLGSFVGGLRQGVSTRNAGGPIGFATGGVVPGTGNRDTVPAMLTPGEFVIRKSSVNKIGAGTLAAMNENRYAKGGNVSRQASRNSQTSKFSVPSEFSFVKGSGTEFNRSKNRFNSRDELKFRRLKDLNIDVFDLFGGNQEDPLYKEYAQYVEKNNPRERGKTFEKIVRDKVGAVLAQSLGKATVDKKGDPASSRLDGVLNGTPIEIRSRSQAVADGVLADKIFGGALKPRSDVDQAMQSKLTNTTLTDSNAPNGKIDSVNFGKVRLIADVTDLSNISDKVNKKLGAEGAVAASRSTIRRVAGKKKAENNFFGGSISKYATGGPAPSDTVPALLTPGEFVLNKGAASSIGRANLDRMNKQGVVGFAAGGAVGNVQKFAEGGRAKIDPLAIAFLLPSVLDSLAGTTEKTDEELNQLGTTSVSVRDGFSQFLTILATAGVAVSTFGINFKNLKSVFTGGAGRSQKRFDELRAGFRANNLSNDDFDEFELARKTRQKRSRRASATRRGVTSGLGRVPGVSPKVASSIGRGAGNLVRAFGSISAVAGPVAIGLGATAAAVVGLNSVIEAGLNLQEKYNAAVKTGNVERAREIATLKSVPGLVAIFGKELSAGVISIKSFFGGESLASVLANAEAQALAGKTTLEFEQNAKIAADALRDIKGGSRSALEALESGDLTKNINNVLRQGAAERRAAEEKFLSELSGITNALGQILGVGPDQRNKTIQADQERQQVEQKTIDAALKAISEQAESFRVANDELIFDNKTFNDFIAKFAAGGTDISSLPLEVFNELAKSFENQVINRLATLESARALNSSLFTLESTVLGLSDVLSDSSDKISGSFDEFSSALRSFKTITQGGSFGIEDFERKLSSVSKSLGALGVDNSIIEKTTKKFRDLNVVSGSFEQVLNQARLNDPEFASNPEEFRIRLGEALSKNPNLQEGEIKSLLGKQDFVKQLFEGLDVSDLASDIPKITKQFIEKLSEGANVDIRVLEAVNKAYSAQAKIIKQATDAELKLIDAKLKQIDVEEESAKILEEFGIKSFTTAKRLELLQKSVSASVGPNFKNSPEDLTKAIILAGAGIKSATTGLTQAGDQIVGAKTQRAADLFRKRLEAISNIASQNIEVQRESLKLAREKIKLDKEAIDSLLAGNIEDFLDKQEAAAARRSLLGNGAALGNFSFTAIGEALKSIQDPDEKRRATQTAVDRGVITQSMADVVNEDTPEIIKLRAEVEKLTQVNEFANKQLTDVQALQSQIASEQQTAGQAAFAQAIQSIATQTQSSAEVNKELDGKITTLNKTLSDTKTEISNLRAAIISERDKRLLEDETRRKELNILPTTLSDKNKQSDALDRLGEEVEAFIKGSVGKIDPSLDTEGIAEDFTKTVRGAGGVVTDFAKEVAKGIPIFGKAVQVFDAIQESGKKNLEEQEKARIDAKTQKKNADEFLQREVLKRQRGGIVPLYARNGMFVPRGTDTVPAMLTPGEYVVNRKAVSKGNNRQILENMNSGRDTVYNNREPLKIDTGNLQNIAKSMSSSFDKFNETVNRLINFNFELTIGNSRIDVVLNTPQALTQMNSIAKEEILNAVVSEIQINHLGKLRRRNRK